jgi:hypothetical protein
MLKLAVRRAELVNRSTAEMQENGGGYRHLSAFSSGYEATTSLNEMVKEGNKEPERLGWDAVALSRKAVQSEKRFQCGRGIAEAHFKSCVSCFSNAAPNGGLKPFVQSFQRLTESQSVAQK